MSRLVPQPSVLPHHQEVHAIEGHVGEVLLAPGDRDGDPVCVQHRAGAADARAVDVVGPAAIVIPHDQVVGAVEAEGRVLLVAAPGGAGMHHQGSRRPARPRGGAAPPCLALVAYSGCHEARHLHPALRCPLGRPCPVDRLRGPRLSQHGGLQRCAGVRGPRRSSGLRRPPAGALRRVQRLRQRHGVLGRPGLVQRGRRRLRVPPPVQRHLRRGFSLQRGGLRGPALR